MTLGHGYDRTGIITPKQASPLLNAGGPPISQIMGGCGKNVLGDSASGAAGTVLWRSAHIPPDKLSTLFNFRVMLAGMLSSNAKDVTLDLNWVEPDGTTVTLAALVSVTLATANDEGFMADFQGRVIQEGTTGEIAAVGFLKAQTTGLLFGIATAVLGVEINLDNGGHFEVTSTWDSEHNDADIYLMSGMMLANNLSPAAGD